MRVLGIDPGYGILGWAVIEDSFKALAYGVIETSKQAHFDDRLHEIHTGMTVIIREYAPETAAMEKLFHARNTTTSLDVAKAIGVVILTLRMHGLRCAEYSPLQVKYALTGYGRASKSQMQEMVLRLFGMKEIPRPDDAADALAIAACHSMAGKSPQRAPIRKSS
ncbi:MAG: crossover junction endodeoxyribonuclease RuvC [Spirochaetes bacterium]|nr:MAG: crossover junction endodeoxyribonuclease RuvC [Spirochaetota bacterium]